MCGARCTFLTLMYSREYIFPILFINTVGIIIDSLHCFGSPSLVQIKFISLLDLRIECFTSCLGEFCQNLINNLNNLKINLYINQLKSISVISQLNILPPAWMSSVEI
jgi:hypothetical protein